MLFRHHPTSKFRDNSLVVPHARGRVPSSQVDLWVCYACLSNSCPADDGEYLGSCTPTPVICALMCHGGFEYITTHMYIIGVATSVKTRQDEMVQLSYSS